MQTGEKRPEPTWSTIRDQVREAEALGYDTLLAVETQHDPYLELAVAAQLHQGATGRDTAGGGDRRALITARGQPGGLAGGVNAADLHRYRCDTRQAQHQHRDQRDDAQRRFHGARADIVDYALVLSARAMMLVNAETMESPVTTV